MISLVEQNGASKWNYISSFLPGRIGKQCRERWCNHLSPCINKSPWSEEEEMLLLMLHHKYGNKWSLISQVLTGRTDNTIKNHWNSAMKKKVDVIEQRCKEILNEFNYNCTYMYDIPHDVIELLTKKIELQMKKVKDEKMKIYETFKRMKLDKCGNGLCNNNDIEYNNMSSMKIRKALGFRTHSKKCKKRGRKKGMKHERSCCSNSNNTSNNIEVVKGIIDTVNESNKDNSNNNNNNELGMNSAFKHYGHTETPDVYYGKNCVCVFNGINKEEAMPKKLEFSSLNKKPVKIICENTSAESSNCVNGNNNKNNNEENENEDNKSTIRKNLEDMFIKTIEQNC